MKDWKLTPDRGRPKKWISLTKKCLELWNTRLNSFKNDEDKNGIKEELRNWCVCDPKGLK